MAGGKETPRQKMIGMMYLVLTALLAMNISKDVLQAFLQINSGLARTASVLQEKAGRTLSSFDSAPEQDKAAPFKAKAVEVNQLADQMADYIELLKARVIACSMKGDPTGESYEEFLNSDKKTCIDLLSPEGKEKVNKLDENQNNTTLLIGSEPQAPISTPWSASELRTKLSEFRDALKALEVTNVSGKVIKPNQEILTALDSAFVFNDSYDDHLELMVKWETANFYHTPLAAVIASLSKIKTDVLNAKASMMSFLAASINATDMKFSDITVAAVPLSSYVLKGDEFVAEVYLAAYNKNSAVKIYPGGEYDGPMPTETSQGAGASGEGISSGPDGKCIFKVNTGGLPLGEHGFKGQIAYDANGETKFLNYFIPPITVGEPGLVVSPTQMNLFYRGLDNPVEISVPGVDPRQLSVSMTGGTISGPGADGTYNVKPGEGKEAIINVSANINGKQTSMPPKKFRIKSIPNPTPMFQGKKPSDNTISMGEVSAAQGVRADMENFEFPVSATVTKFVVSATVNGNPKDIAVTGNILNSEAKSLLGKLKKGEKFYIEQIDCKLPDGRSVRLSPISLKIL
jgi:gliding motility-associated protein GldM